MHLFLRFIGVEVTREWQLLLPELWCQKCRGVCGVAGSFSLLRDTPGVSVVAPKERKGVEWLQQEPPGPDSLQRRAVHWPLFTLGGKRHM